MKSSDIAANLKPEVIESFRRAIEIGKWPDGSPLSKEQRDICMQAVIAYEYHNLAEHERTGYVPPKPGACGHDHHQPAGEATLKWQDDS